MRKLLLIKFICIFAISSFAEGYQVNLLSARQVGMGHTGTALKLGAESMHFNPAGMVFMNSKFSFSAGISGTFTNANWTQGDKTWSSNNSKGTPLYFYAAYKPIENLAIGFSFTTPYGNSLNWGKNWAGSHMVQDVDLKAYFFQPTISYKILDNLSIGVGMVVMTGSFDLNKGLMPSGSLKPYLGDKYANITPGSVNLKGNSEIDYGFNVGLLYDFNSSLSIGLSYRSKMYADVKKGEVQTSYVDATAQGFIFMNPEAKAGDALVNASSFASSLPMPANTSLGVAYKASDKLTLTADLQFVQWSEYEELNFDFTKSPDFKVEKNYDDTFIYRLGAEYIVNDIFTIRTGVYYDETPVNKSYYNPETPGMNKLGLSAGSTIKLMDGFNLDIAMLYIKGFEIEGTVSDPNIYIPNNQFAGTYTSTGFVPSIGLSYSF